MRRCAKCVLPESCPGIKFDERGVCNVCVQFERQWGGFRERANVDARRRELENIFDSVRRKGRRYDCLVPLSGGFDSMYVLYVCKKVYNLKVLAFNFDNGFKSDFAEENLKNAVSSLDVDYKVFRPDWEIAKRLYALFFRKTGEFCTPCNIGIWSSSYITAKQMGIPLIVMGSSGKIESQLPPGCHVYSWSKAYFKEVCRGEMPLRLVRDYLHFPESLLENIARLISRPISVFDKVRIINLPSFVDWNVKSILEELETKMSWQHPQNRHHRIDCILEPVRVFLIQKRMGFSAAETYSTLIRNGQITREEALRRTIDEEREAAQEPPEMKVWMDRLDLSYEDLEGFQKRSQLPFIPFRENLRKTVENTLRKMLIQNRLRILTK